MSWDSKNPHITTALEEEGMGAKLPRLQILSCCTPEDGFLGDKNKI